VSALDPLASAFVIFVEVFFSTDLFFVHSLLALFLFVKSMLCTLYTRVVFYLSSESCSQLSHTVPVCNFRQRSVLYLTPSLPGSHLKTTNKIAKFVTLKPFCLLFRTGM